MPFYNISILLIIIMLQIQNPVHSRLNRSADSFIIEDKIKEMVRILAQTGIASATKKQMNRQNEFENRITSGLRAWLHPKGVFIWILLIELLIGGPIIIYLSIQLIDADYNNEARFLSIGWYANGVLTLLEILPLIGWFIIAGAFGIGLEFKGGLGSFGEGFAKIIAIMIALLLFVFLFIAIIGIFLNFLTGYAIRRKKWYGFCSFVCIWNFLLLPHGPIISIYTLFKLAGKNERGRTPVP